MTSLPDSPPSTVVPPIPERPDSAAPPLRRRSFLPIILATVVGILGFASLSLLSGGFFVLVGLVGLAVLSMIAFHYLVWGWWLGDRIQREGDFDDS